MNDLCILIELSDSGFVTRWHGKGCNGFETFAETPCTVVIGNELFFSLRKNVADFTRQMTSSASLCNLPVVLMFRNDVPDIDIAKLSMQFAATEFHNVSIFNFGKVLSNVLNKGNIMFLEKDGDNLAVAIYDGEGKVLKQKKLEGLGANPNVSNAVDLLWDSLGYDAYYLNKDSEKEKLRLFAEDFLKSGRSEINDYITLSDGHQHSCFLSKCEVENRKSDNALARELAHLLDAVGMLGADCNLILGKDTVDDYFHKLDSHIGFKTVTALDEKVTSAIWKYIINSIETPTSVTLSSKPSPSSPPAPPPPPPSTAPKTKTSSTVAPPPPPPTVAPQKKNVAPPPPPPTVAPKRSCPPPPPPPLATIK